MSDSSDITSTFRVTVDNDDGPSPLAAIRLGTYLAEEDSWIDTSITLSDGFYLMTNAYLTTNIDGATFIYAGENISTKGDKSITISDAGQTSIRAQSTGFGANESPPTTGGNVTLDATKAVTLESAHDIIVTCDSLVYIVADQYTNKTASSDTETADGVIEITVGGLSEIVLFAGIDIASVGFEPMTFDHSLGVISLSSAAVEFTGELFKMENHGMKAFLCGMLLPLRKAEASVSGVGNRNRVISSVESDIDADERGADSNLSLLSNRSSSVVSVL